MNEEQLVWLLVRWYYETDLKLDEADLDAFHSIIVESAKKFAKELLTPPIKA